MLTTRRSREGGTLADVLGAEMVSTEHGLQSLPAQQPGLIKLLGHVTPSVADLVVLALVHSQRHQFEIGDDVVDFGADGAGHDMVNEELVAGAEAIS